MALLRFCVTGLYECVGTCRLWVWSKLVKWDSLRDSLLELGLEDTKPKKHPKVTKTQKNNKTQIPA